MQVIRVQPWGTVTQETANDGNKIAKENDDPNAAAPPVPGCQKRAPSSEQNVRQTNDQSLNEERN
jgi:hypothetical protein